MPGLPDYTGVTEWNAELRRAADTIGKIQTIYQMAVQLKEQKAQYFELDGSSNPVYPVTVAAMDVVFIPVNLSDVFDVIDILDAQVTSLISGYAALLSA